MNWQEIREKHPNQWLVVEALEARTEPNGSRTIEHFTVLETCANGVVSFRKYCQLQAGHPDREYYYLHTGRENLDIAEEKWIGIRTPYAASA